MYVPKTTPPFLDINVQPLRHPHGILKIKVRKAYGDDAMWEYGGPENVSF